MEALADVDLRQSERLIKARFYRWMTHTYGGLWERAAADVLALTGVDIPAESLRQNIEPVSKKAGIPARRFKDPKRLTALKDFLISQHYLSEAELSQADPSLHAADMLSSFLSGEAATPAYAGWERFRGRFSGHRETAGSIESIDIHIDYRSPDEPVRVTEETRIAYVEAPEMTETNQFTGWAVCNDEGFYMLFLKGTYMAKCYLVLQTAPAITSEGPIYDIAVVSYDSAWTGTLKKTVTAIHDLADKTEYSLPRGVESLCIFLTRA